MKTFIINKNKNVSYWKHHQLVHRMHHHVLLCPSRRHPWSLRILVSRTRWCPHHYGELQVRCYVSPNWIYDLRRVINNASCQLILKLNNNTRIKIFMFSPFLYHNQNLPLKAVIYFSLHIFTFHKSMF